MKILLCGATAGSNFGDFLFAKIFQDCASEIVGKENVIWYSSFGAYSRFFEKYLDNHNHCRFSQIDAMVYISGGYFFGNDIRRKNYIARFLRYCLVGLKCKIFKKPYIIIGMECGPSNSKLMRRIQSYIIKNARYISVRNKESYKYVRNNIRKDVELTFDTALCIPDSFDKNLSDFIPKKNKRLLIHISDVPEQNKVIIEKIIPIVNSILEKENYTIALSADQYFSDQKAALKQVAKSINTDDVELYEYRNPYKLCELIKASDVVITTKLHVGIVGARYGCSVISFSGHTEKIRRFYEQIGQAGRTIAFSDVSFKTGYNMLEEYKDKRIVLDQACYEEAEKNLDMTRRFIHSCM